MFNTHLYPSFHSHKASFEGTGGHRSSMQPTNFDRRGSSTLALWRDSLIKQDELESLYGDRTKVWRKEHGVKKLSYLPTPVGRVGGIEEFFSTGGKLRPNIVVPTRYKPNKAKHRHQLFYLIPRNVTITYGPYFYSGILDYRIERLHGLQSALTFAGANPRLRPVHQINHVAVWYLEKEIFSCKITELHHGGDGELDPLCFAAANAFTKQSRKVMLHVRHKYRFDNKKFVTCPCHTGAEGLSKLPDYFEEDEYSYDEDEDVDEFMGEDEFTHVFIDPYLGEIGGEDVEVEGEIVKQNTTEPKDGKGRLPRISLHSHLRVKFKPRPEDGVTDKPPLSQRKSKQNYKLFGKKPGHDEKQKSKAKRLADILRKKPSVKLETILDVRRAEFSGEGGEGEM